jgi:hypothetical protein
MQVLVVEVDVVVAAARVWVVVGRVARMGGGTVVKSSMNRSPSMSRPSPR